MTGELITVPRRDWEQLQADLTSLRDKVEQLEQQPQEEPGIRGRWLRFRERARAARARREEA